MGTKPVCLGREGRWWEAGWGASEHHSSFSQVLDYDHYGAYGTPVHEDYAYGRLLADEYTFDFPPHHDMVSGRIPPSLMQERGGFPAELTPSGPAGAPARGSVGSLEACLTPF